MTEAMPFLQKTILLSYDPRSLDPGLCFSLFFYFTRVRSPIVSQFAVS